MTTYVVLYRAIDSDVKTCTKCYDVQTESTGQVKGWFYWYIWQKLDEKCRNLVQEIVYADINARPNL